LIPCEGTGWRRRQQLIRDLHNTRQMCWTRRTKIMAVLPQFFSGKPLYTTPKHYTRWLTSKAANRSPVHTSPNVGIMIAASRSANTNTQVE
jgi:hypothetical protein